MWIRALILPPIDSVLGLAPSHHCPVANIGSPEQDIHTTRSSFYKQSMHQCLVEFSNTHTHTHTNCLTHTHMHTTLSHTHTQTHSCQFVVSVSGDYSAHTADPDLLVDWNSIEQVVRIYKLSCGIKMWGSFYTMGSLCYLIWESLANLQMVSALHRVCICLATPITHLLCWPYVKCTS